MEGKVRRRSYKPGWRRLSFRIALGAGVWEIGYLATQDLDATVQNTQELWHNREQVLATLESSGIGAASVLTVGTAAYMALTRERRELMREWVVPLHEPIHRPLGLAEQTDPRRYPHIPKNFSDDDAEIRIDLPGHLDFSRDVIADRITQKLALEGVTFDRHPKGSKPYVRVKKTAPGEGPLQKPQGPRAGGQGPGVRAHHRARHRRADRLRRPGRRLPAHPGQRLHRRRLCCIVCQMLHHGSLVFVLDTKRISHPWAHGIDGVTYCRDIADIHDQLIELGQIGRLRTRIADELGIDADPKAIGPRVLILLEEINATMKQLARYWEKIRESGDPKVSPAADALNEILYMGR
ncbi:hypothetical protein [Streptomyces sp. NPDC001135]